MAGIYPLRPIITSDTALGALYDDHPWSVFNISACMTPQAAAALLDRGAVFDGVVLLNGEGRELIERLLPQGDYDPEVHPRVEQLELAAAAGPQAVKAIHRKLQALGLPAFVRRIV
jgi:hypothetical protein